MPPPASLDALKQQLVDSGATDYVVHGANGLVVAAAGVFESSSDKRNAAFSVLQQSAALLKPGERLKRTTLRFADTVFVASCATVQGQTFGIVVQRSQ